MSFTGCCLCSAERSAEGDCLTIGCNEGPTPRFSHLVIKERGKFECLVREAEGHNIPMEGDFALFLIREALERCHSQMPFLWEADGKDSSGEPIADLWENIRVSSPAAIGRMLPIAMSVLFPKPLEKS